MTIPVSSEDARGSPAFCEAGGDPCGFYWWNDKLVAHLSSQFTFLGMSYFELGGSFALLSIPILFASRTERKENENQ